MGPDQVLELSTQALELALRVALPLLGVGLIVGLAVSIFQAVTQIQEQTLAFIPKILALAGVLIVGGPWMLNQLLSYTTELWSRIPHPRRMTAAELISRFGEQHVAAFILVLARVGPLFILAPMFSSKLIPLRVRGIVAVALAIGLSPVVSKGVVLPLGVMDMTWLVLKEMLIGGAFAFAVGGLAAALSAAGSLIDTSIGFSYGSLVDPLTGTQSTVLSQAYALVGMLVFIAIGGDGWVVQGLARTYDLVGLDQAPQLGRLVAGVDAVFGSILISAMEVAGPVLLALILTDAAFGVVSRVVPQLNVFAVGFPAKVVVGLLLVTATLPFVAGWIGDELQQDVGAALQAIRVA